MAILSSTLVNLSITKARLTSMRRTRAGWFALLVGLVCVAGWFALLVGSLRWLVCVEGGRREGGGRGGVCEDGLALENENQPTK